MAVGLGRHRLMLGPSDAISDLDLFVEATTEEMFKGLDTAAGISAQIQDQGFVFARLIDHGVSL